MVGGSQVLYPGSLVIAFHVIHIRYFSRVGGCHLQCLAGLSRECRTSSRIKYERTCRAVHFHFDNHLFTYHPVRYSCLILLGEYRNRHAKGDDDSYHTSCVLHKLILFADFFCFQNCLISVYNTSGNTQIIEKEQVL